jgi:putative nucleotidyltransferase-like protein
MSNGESSTPDEKKYLNILSTLLFCGGDRSRTASLEEALRQVGSLSEEELRAFFDLANVHHVTVRSLQTLREMVHIRGESKLAAILQEHWDAEHQRIQNALAFLDHICRALDRAGCPVTVIKSLDHWPDLGGDLDLFTTGERESVINVFTKQFGAEPEPQSWGDRLANKWNFRIPGLRELVECHVKCLGQTGEQVALAARLQARRTTREIERYTFPVPAPEERIIVATLQRMYRHFYIRLCDIANIARLLEQGAVDFQELKKTADLGSIWPGVATLLVIVAEYFQRYTGRGLNLPGAVKNDARFSGTRTYIDRQFLRIPIVPEAAQLYSRQMIGIGASGNLRGALRLSLLPALATAAFLGYRITGSDKGIW